MISVCAQRYSRIASTAVRAASPTRTTAATTASGPATGRTDVASAPPPIAETNAYSPSTVPIPSPAAAPTANLLRAAKPINSTDIAPTWIAMAYPAIRPARIAAVIGRAATSVRPRSRPAVAPGRRPTRQGRDGVLRSCGHDPGTAPSAAIHFQPSRYHCRALSPNTAV
jgi:hypothetical protein